MSLHPRPTWHNPLGYRNDWITVLDGDIMTVVQTFDDHRRCFKVLLHRTMSTHYTFFTRSDCYVRLAK